MLKDLSPSQLRSKFLDFFSSPPRNAKVIPSASLIPENDSTTLFINSGMQPLVPFLLGQPHPLGKRLANSQKSLRTEDIEEVGDNRHTTFFEMLGDWSLGDFFKQEQLTWIFEFFTEILSIDPARLYVSVFKGDPNLGFKEDKEAIEIWTKLFKDKGVDPSTHIFKYGASKNWWSRSGEPQNMPEGEPGGPSSEIFFDFLDTSIHENSIYKDKECHINCDCGRFLEIGNNVFMQYKKTKKGFELLSQKNIDFGAGLERILAVLNNDPDIFKTKAFLPIIENIQKQTLKKYGVDKSITKDMRIVADHLRASIFLIKDNVLPSNKEAGYFVRKLLRRLFLRLFYINDKNLDLFTSLDLSSFVSSVIFIYDDIYFDTKDVKDITPVLEDELSIFLKVFNKGHKIFKNLSDLDGVKAFDLYQTYGLPLDLIKDLALLYKVSLSTNFDKEFEQKKQEHSKQSKAGSIGHFRSGLGDINNTTIKYHTATHLLHSALRKILGESVQQKGSNITTQRLRFDFSYDKPLTQEQKKQIEDLVNSWIQEGLDVKKYTMKKDEALASGALGFFIDKYPDIVTVYEIGDETKIVSKEICTGPHVKNTSELPKVKIIKEKSSSKGIRRIYIKFV